MLVWVLAVIRLLMHVPVLFCSSGLPLLGLIVLSKVSDLEAECSGIIGNNGEGDVSIADIKEGYSRYTIHSLGIMSIDLQHCRSISTYVSSS